jgi:hypothetical protein
MIESAKGVERAREIAAVGGLGAIEPVHLSDGDTKAIIAMCQEKGVYLATEAEPEDVAARIAEGYRLIPPRLGLQPAPAGARRQNQEDPGDSREA